MIIRRARFQLLMFMLAGPAVVLGCAAEHDGAPPLAVQFQHGDEQGS